MNTGRKMNENNKKNTTNMTYIVLYDRNDEIFKYLCCTIFCVDIWFILFITKLAILAKKSDP